MGTGTAKKASSKSPRTGGRARGTVGTRRVPVPTAKSYENQIRELLATFDIHLPELSFYSLTESIGGPRVAFSYLNYEAVEDQTIAALVDDWYQLHEDERLLMKPADVDTFITTRSVSIARLFGLVAERMVKVGADVLTMMQAASRPMLLQRAIEHASLHHHGEKERGRLLEAAGLMPASKAAQIINVSATAQAGVAIEDRGLPSFEETMKDATPQRLIEAEAETVDVPFQTVEVEDEV